MTQDGCKTCLRVREILSDIEASSPMVIVREVRLNSDEGFELALTFGIVFPPAILIDGKLLGQDEIPEDELRRALGVPLAEAH